MSLRHAILGFLALRPLTGYDLKKYFDASVQHFWSADQAQIYRTLTQLNRDGLVDIQVVPQDGRPDRKEHHITSRGRGELDTWLAAPDEPQPAHEAFLLKLFFAARLPAGGLAALLDSRITAATEQLDALRAVARHTLTTGLDSPERRLAAATLENGLRHVTAELDWLHALRTDTDDPSRAATRLARLADQPTHPAGPPKEPTGLAERSSSARRAGEPSFPEPPLTS